MNHFLEVVIKIEVKDNNETGTRVLKRKSQGWLFMSLSLRILMKNHFQKEFTRKYQRVKKLNKLKNRI